jgi:hypothetical protein
MMQAGGVLGWHPVCLETSMRFVLAFVIAAHGIGASRGLHFVVEACDPRGTSLQDDIFSGRLDVGDAGIRVIGVLWLLAALAFLIGPIAVTTEASWAGRFLFAAVIASTLLCVAGWPDARIGLAVNLGLALVLAIGARLHLAMLTP